MTLHLIGLGLSINGISIEAKNTLNNCKEAYLEGYTVGFPYTKEELETTLERTIILLKRETVENEELITKAKKEDIALLIYGDPLSATTHQQLINACKEQEVEHKVYHNASIYTAITETGLSIYKYGKTTSMPNWKEHTNKPTSYATYIKENQNIKAHTLLLIDIGLPIKEALTQLEETTKKEELTLPEELLILEKAGTNKQQLHKGTITTLKEKEIQEPYSIIIPGELSHHEQETLNTLVP